MKFSCDYTVTINGSVEVEAKDLHDARNKAEDIICDKGFEVDLCGADYRVWCVTNDETGEGLEF